MFIAGLALANLLLQIEPPSASGQALTLSKTTLPADFAVEFRRAYDQRRRDPGRSADVPTNLPDPAISQDLDLIIGHSARLLKQGATARQVENLVESAVERTIGKSSGLPEPSWADADSYGCVSLRIESVHSVRFIVATMGAVSRMAAWDQHWNEIVLPKEFSWNYPWRPRLWGLPSGLVLVSEEGIEAMGIRDGIRLVWLDIRAGSAKIVGRVQGETTLDHLEPIVRGNRVTITTIDNPKTFSVTAAETTLRRDRTWDVSGHRPQLIRNKALEPGLRLVDQTIWNAWHAQRPTRRQRFIKSIWPENDRSLICSEKWAARKGTVTIGASARFDLAYNTKGKLVVLGVRQQ